MGGLTENHFRILELLPGNRTDPLHCKLETAKLDNHPPYEALSYRWGSTTNTIDIRVGDDQRCAITKSLEAILLRLRLPWKSQKLWIDQLCIDQSNTEEKTAQVKQMHNIYSKCTQCLIWLGDFAKDTNPRDAEAAVSVINYIAAFRTKGENPAPTRPTCMESDGAFRDAMRALGAISPDRCEWWRRAWTLQEALLPSHVVFSWGSLAFSWTTALAASDVWKQKGRYHFDTAGMNSTQMHIAEREAHMGALMNAVNGLSTTGPDRDVPRPGVIKHRSRVATEPRDNVYALIGLYKDHMPLSSECNYSLAVNQVFINFTLDLIQSGGPTLKPLVLDPRPTDGQLPGLPRWVIDMRSSPEQSPGLWRSFWYYDHCYEANNGLPDSGRPNIVDPNEGLQDADRSENATQHLLLSGVLVDTVDKVGPERSQNLRADTIYWWNLYCDESNRLSAARPRGRPMIDCKEYFEFCRLLLGYRLEQWNHRPGDLVTHENLQSVSEILEMNADYQGTMRNIKKQIENRRFFVTKGGLIGLGHLETEPGDEVWVSNHGRVPFTLTPAGTGDQDYNFVGHCYVQGIMLGLGADKLANSEQRQVRLY